jgi:hypothetical protein
MECKKEENAKNCNCTYPCERKDYAEGNFPEGFCETKGLCCECVAYHRDRGELPACYFDKETEKTYDRSVENYCKMKGII